MYLQNMRYRRDMSPETIFIVQGKTRVTSRGPGHGSG